MADQYGKAWLTRAGIGFWWRYDLTTGAAHAWVRQDKTLRFYGLTIGNLCIGLMLSRKEGPHRG